MEKIGMMRNKRGWLRILEAFLAVLIIASVLLIMVTRMPGRDRGEEIHEMQRLILRQVALNDGLREEILNDEISEKVKTKDFIKEMAPVYWEFEVEICEIGVVCKIDYIAKDVYADEILISSTLEEYQPKKLKLFVWER